MKHFRLLAVLLLAGVAAAADVLDDYQTRYTKAGWQSAREEVVKAIAATGKLEAMKALQWCKTVAKDAVEDARKDSDKANAKVVPVREKIEQKIREWVEEERKKGNEVDVTRTPNWPDYEELMAANAAVTRAENVVIASQAMVGFIVDAQGSLVAKLAPELQATVREDWTKNRLNSKDWAVRGELYDTLGHTPSDWSLAMLLSAVTTEADPRALVVAVDGLAGKDASKVTPTLISRLDDVRWLVRAAVVSALERTPSKEGIDGLVKRLPKEDGRMKDDLARSLRTLTGEDMPGNGEMWRVWWGTNREKWAGIPVAKTPAEIEAASKAAAASNAGKTGFFGLAIESKRVVFVIDVSGSMVWEMGGKGPEAKKSRAEMAKQELKRVLAGLEDGTTFNMVFFASTVKVWKPEMQKADVKVRREAQDYVDAVDVMGGTNTYDALEAAFALGDMGRGRKREADPSGDARVDTVVLLSDGKPSQGRTSDPDAIRTAVKGWNKSRRVVVHAIAFGTSAATSKEREGADPVFMKGLADDSGGTYIEK